MNEPFSAYIAPTRKGVQIHPQFTNKLILLVELTRIERATS